MVTTPASLLEQLRNDTSRQGWRHFVELYTPILFGWARHLGLTEPDAADLVQDIFVVLVEKLPGFVYDPSQSFRAWLKTILLNRWRNRCRRHSACQTLGEGMDKLAIADEVPFFEEEEYRKAVVQRALTLMQAEFEPTTWRACWEFVVQDRPAAEVAAELGISPNAVYLAKGRVLRRLREQLRGLIDCESA